MCSICENTQPWIEGCFYEDLAPGSGGNDAGDTFASMPVYSYDQIADQLTNGYWGGNARSFDVSAGDTLYVDITNLTLNGQAMARQALDAWSMVSGLNFVEVNSNTPASATVFENGDAPQAINTDHLISLGEDFEGTLASNGERDTIAIHLTAGQTVTLKLEGTGNAPLADPYLYVMNGSGAILAQNDDANGTDSAVTYQATYTGYHYVQAAAFNDASAGTYTVSARQDGQAAQITFDDNNSGAYASSSVWNGTILSSHINIDDNWAGGSARTDGYFYQTYVHEIGHALGLGHAGNYNGAATYGSSNHYENDSWQASVMSYFHQAENTSVDADFAYVAGPQMADILAVQSLYGTPTHSNEGDSVYGDNGNTGTYLDGIHNLSNPVSYTVFDTGGTDEFDFSSSSAHQVLDLREEHYSDLDGHEGNVGIARGTIIENGKTGGGNDALIGNSAHNELNAGHGHDTVESGGGNDAILGGGGNDTLSGEDGADFIEGGNGADLINGNDGHDLLIADEVSLAMLSLFYPSWTPPSQAQSWIDTEDHILLWDDLIDDLGIA